MWRAGAGGADGMNFARGRLFGNECKHRRQRPPSLAGLRRSNGLARFGALAPATIAAAGAARAQESRPVPLVLDGQTVKIELVVHKPPGNRKFPTLVFNHGSTGRGNNPSAFQTRLGPPVRGR